MYSPVGMAGRWTTLSHQGLPSLPHVKPQLSSAGLCLTNGVRLSRKLDAAMLKFLYPLLELYFLLHDLQEATLEPR